MFGRSRLWGGALRPPGEVRPGPPALGTFWDLPVPFSLIQSRGCFSKVNSLGQGCSHDSCSLGLDLTLLSEVFVGQ